MFDEGLHESETRSWLYVAIWSLCIFMTVPLARATQAYVSEHWGRDLFMHSVIITIIAVLCAALLKLRLRRRITTAKNYLWLLGVSGVFIAYTIHFRRNPEEAVQWLTPNRVWGMKDIWLDTFSAILVMLALAKGFEPDIVSGPPTRASGQMFCDDNCPFRK